MSQPIRGYEPGPEEHGSSAKRYRVYVDKEPLAAFGEEWVACQYMDEQAAAAQDDANRLGEHYLFTVIDEDSYGSSAVVACAAVHPSRATFERTDRPRVADSSSLSVRAQLASLKKERA